MPILHGTGHHEVNGTADQLGQFGLKGEIVAQPRPELPVRQELHEEVDVAAVRIERIGRG